MPRVPRHPTVWFSALLCWFALLWVLSSMHGSPVTPPKIPHLDKLAHFSYFSAGGFLFAAWNFRRNTAQPRWKLIIWSTILVMAAIGAIDEWHQSFTPGRNGCDPGDWLADLLGGAAGAVFFKAIHRRLL